MSRQPEAATETQDAQASAEAVLWMDSTFEDVGDDAGRVRPRLLCPLDQPLWCPFGVFAWLLGMRPVWVV